MGKAQGSELAATGVRSVWRWRGHAADARVLPADYPVEWDHNDHGDLEVTITLPELRPHPPWCHQGDDVVLAVRDASLTEITVTYTVTAQGYGTVFEGEPFTMPVEQVDIFDAAKFALDASATTDAGWQTER